MVYESDFYTTRRPYRPSSYSVSAELIYRPTSRTITRLATYPEAPHHVVRVRVRPSVILRELDRIAYRRRPDYSISALDDYYRSEASKSFEDETRRIRADTASLLHRARSVVPRAKSLAPLDTIYSYSYGEPIPYRFSNDAYIAKLLLPLRSVTDHIHNISFYSEPAKRFTGRGHLACVHYSGKKGFPNRRPLYPLYKELSIRDDVNLLSFYAKNRLAAAGLADETVTVKLLPWRPSRKFQTPSMMEDPELELKAAKAEREARFRATTAEPVLTPSADLAEIKRKRQAEARLAEEKALKEEAKREAGRKAQAEREAAEKKRQEEEARKAEELKRQAEDEARRAEEKARKAEEDAMKAAEEAARKAEEERIAEEARQVEEARKAEEERLAEEARLADEARLAEEARIAEEERLAEETRLAEEARIAEEARLAEEAKLAEEARLEEERLAEQMRQEELAKLEELERQAQEEREAELARQAAELAEIARQESELAAARLEELSHSGSAGDNIAEVESSEQPADEPIVEEPESPVAVPETLAEPQEAVEISEDEMAEPDVTDEE